MNKITLWNWDKKKRTMLRSIQAGDIFCFQYNQNTYCFGRIISRWNGGAPSEIFDYVSEEPVIPQEVIEKGVRMFHPVNLDIYPLFDRKFSGDWRIIGHCDGFTPADVENVFFACGVCPYYKIDLYDNKEMITEDESKKLQSFAFFSDFHVKKLVQPNIKQDYIATYQNQPSRKTPKLKHPIEPFTISETGGGMSLLLNAGSYKNHVFEKEAEKGFCGNGYDWTSLARTFLKEALPDLQKDIQFDPEADMFCAYSEHKESILAFAQSFHKMCEDEKLMGEMLSRSEPD